MKRLSTVGLLLAFAACGSSDEGGSPNGGASSSGATSSSSGSPCTTSDDCRLFSDTCNGNCNCRALAKTEPDPACPQGGVSCESDPCGDRVPVCREGVCSGAAPPAVDASADVATD